MKKALKRGLVGIISAFTMSYSLNGPLKAQNEVSIGPELRDAGLYEEVLKDKIKDPKNAEIKPEKDIINFISLYPEKRKRDSIIRTNAVEDVMYRFNADLESDPFYLARRIFEHNWQKKEELAPEGVFDNFPYEGQIGQAVWDTCVDRLEWAKKIDLGIRKVQKVTTAEVKVKKDIKIKIKPLIESLGAEEKIKARIDLKGLKHIDYLNSKIGTESLKLGIGRYFQKFGGDSIIYAETGYNWEDKDFSILFSIEVANLSFWKRKNYSDSKKAPDYGALERRDRNGFDRLED